MSTTKTKILKTAREMFNSQGYSAVTIRMIAQELGMSSGNLTYHFQKREDILEALYFEMVAVFDERVNTLDTTDLSLNRMYTDVCKSLERMVEYRFFWTDLYNLLRLNSALEKHFTKAYQQRQVGTAYFFQQLQKKQVMHAFEFREEQNLLIERMINHSNTWLYNSSVKNEKLSAAFIHKQAAALISMLYPYLTKTGKSDFKMLFPEFFD